MRVYAVGDIHGRCDLLKQLLTRIRADADKPSLKYSLVFVGDYVDRGLQSKVVIDWLLDLQLPDWDVVFLRGNHDQSVLDFIDNPALYRAWRSYGAAETLLSYGVKPPSFDDDQAFVTARDDFVRKCPPSHLEFLRSLRYFHVIGDYMFVHAGVRPGIALDQQSPEDLMWIRDDFLRWDGPYGKVIVHGHSPTSSPVRTSNRVGIDTGAYATGCLTAAALEGTHCTFLSTA